jgi:DHA1 family tetracycline resistance protein-like MFS transporter
MKSPGEDRSMGPPRGYRGILAVTLLDTIAFAMMIVLLSFVAKDHFHTSALTVGLLMSVKQAVTIIVAPLLGRASDRWGRRNLLLCSLLGTMISYAMLGFAPTVGWLFLARCLDGLTGANFSLFQAVLGDTSTRENRAKAMGIAGALFGVGFILGPLLGTALSLRPEVGDALIRSLSIPVSTPYTFGFLVASLLAFSAFLTAWLAVPETTPQGPAPAGESTMRDILTAGPASPYIWLSFLFYLAIFTLDVAFSLYCQQRFQMRIGRVFGLLALVGLAEALIQCLVVSALARRVGEHRLALTGFAVMAGALFTWSAAQTLPVLVVALLTFAMGAGTLNTLLRSIVSRSVPDEIQGGAMGVLGGLSGLARLVASVGATTLLDIATWAPGAAAGSLAIAGLGVLIMIPRFSSPAVDFESGRLQSARGRGVAM